VADAVRERAGLARARAGDDEKRASFVERRAAVLDGATLLRIKFVKARRRHGPRIG